MYWKDEYKIEDLGLTGTLMFAGGYGELEALGGGAEAGQLWTSTCQRNLISILVLDLPTNLE